MWSARMQRKQPVERMPNSETRNEVNELKVNCEKELAEAKPALEQAQFAASQLDNK